MNEWWRPLGRPLWLFILASWPAQVREACEVGVQTMFSQSYLIWKVWGSRGRSAGLSAVSLWPGDRGDNSIHASVSHDIRTHYEPTLHQHRRTNLRTFLYRIDRGMRQFTRAFGVAR